MSSAKWLNGRLVDIQERLVGLGHPASKPVISRLLRAHDYRLRANVNGAGGATHPDRDCQFRYIQAQRAQYLAQGLPVISVDTKKKELIGNFKNPGRTWGQTPEQVDAHDFPQDGLGRAVPYGIYDLHANCGTVYVGQSADTPAFAVSNLAHWVRSEMRERYPGARQLLIEADSGGSNSARPPAVVYSAVEPSRYCWGTSMRWSLHASCWRPSRGGTLRAGHRRRVPCGQTVM